MTTTTRSPKSGGTRWMPAVLLAGFSVVLGILSFADRAPGTTQAALRRVQDVGRKVENRSGLDVIDRGDVPLAFDTAGHLFLWFIAGVIGWWAFSRRTSPVFLALCLFTISAGVEVGQSYLSTSRSPDLLDLVANGAGILFGVSFAVMFGGAVGAFGRLVTNRSFSKS